MKDSVKQDNRRALPKFLAVVVCAALLGGIGGFFGAMAADEGTLEAIRAGLDRMMRLIGPWGIPASGVLLLFPAWLCYRSACKQYGAWDPDSEEGTEEIERRMNLSMLLTTLGMIFDFFFLAASFQFAQPLLNSALFLLSLVCITLLQQKIVDLTRRMNPEKQGSIYEMKFQKTWFASCDEAERAQIGQASFQAFRTASVACMIVWLVLTLLNFTAGTGLLPVLAVLVVLGVLQVSYILACMGMHSRR